MSNGTPPEKWNLALIFLMDFLALLVHHMGIFGTTRRSVVFLVSNSVIKYISLSDQLVDVTVTHLRRHPCDHPISC